MATKKAKTVTGEPVYMRRLARDFGNGKKGTFALILNPKVFGSTGENWLGGVTYADRSAAMAAAAAAGRPVANAPKAA